MSYVLTYKVESGENNFDGNSMHRCLDVIELEKTLSSFKKHKLMKKQTNKKTTKKRTYEKQTYEKTNLHVVSGSLTTYTTPELDLIVASP